MIGTYHHAGIQQVLEPFQFTRGSNLSFYEETRTKFSLLLQKRWITLEKSRLPPSSRLDEVLELLLRLSDGQLDEYLLQPEVSHRILMAAHYSPQDTLDFFHATLSAQSAKQAHSFNHRRMPRLWSANGDYLIDFDETNGYQEYEAPCVGGHIPIDFFSPFCQGLSQAEIHESPDTVFSLYSIDEAEEVFEKMETSIEPLSDNPNFHTLICQFNKVVMAKKQQNADGRRPFISGSDGLFIGRTHVMNAETVGPEVLAEMFLHEAIHTVLYMIEESKPWMPGNDDALRIGITVPSNWSGNLLSIRSYFQAVFVWFGIWNLWSYAAANGLYDPSWVARRLGYVRNGFATLDMKNIEFIYGISLGDELLDTISEARALVLKG